MFVSLLLMSGLMGQALPWPTSLGYSNPIMALVAGPGKLMVPAMAIFGIERVMVGPVTHGPPSSVAPPPAQMKRAQPAPTPIPVRPSIGELPPPAPPVKIPDGRP